MKRVFKGFLYFILIILVLGVLFLGSILATLPDVKILTDQTPSTSSFIEYRQQESLGKGKELNVQQKWIDLKYIPSLIQRTVIVAEDASFWVHEGVDWYELEQSIRDNIEEGKRLRGASTITQQTAKNLYLSPERSLLRKFKELLIAQRMEEQLTKLRILELYLNFIEFGKGVFGIRSACNYYFKKHPSELSVSETVRLISIIPNPLHLNPNRPSRDLRWRCRTILERLHKYNWISEDEYLSASLELDAFFNQK